MAKYRVISKGSLVTVKSRLSFREQVNERELGVFGRQLFKGCFHPVREGKRTIVYTAPDVMELGRFLRRPVTEETFYGMIAQTAEMVKRVEMNGLYSGNLILNTKVTFICERTGELFFIYQPLISRYAGGNVYVFIEQLTRTAAKVNGSNCRFLKEFETFLSDKANYRVDDIEAFVKRACPSAYRNVADKERGCPAMKDRTVYEECVYEDREERGTTLLSEEERGTTLLSEEGRGGTVLLDAEEGTTMLAPEESFPMLIRDKTGERTAIGTDRFLIGKDYGCDYMVSDNKAVSRRHAIIEKKNGVYYITDQNSTNHTFLNGQQIDSGRAYALSDKTIIRIADEEFEFVQ